MSEEGIEQLKISPEAEEAGRSPANISAQREAAYFADGAEEYRLRHNQQNLGWLGKWFGAGSAAPTNIAGLILVLSFLLLGTTLCFENSEDFREKIYTIITLTLGYLFGATTSSKS